MTSQNHPNSKLLSHNLQAPQISLTIKSLGRFQCILKACLSWHHYLWWERVGAKVKSTGHSAKSLKLITPEWFQRILEGLADHDIVNCERGLWLSLKGFGIISEYLIKLLKLTSHKTCKLPNFHCYGGQKIYVSSCPAYASTRISMRVGSFTFSSHLTWTDVRKQSPQLPEVRGLGAEPPAIGNYGGFTSKIIHF